jgi:hypothetical protein
MRDGNRRKLGLEPAIHELLYVRKRSAMVTNEALQKAHVGARIDHRSLEAQGIDREPRPQIPRAAFEMERHGYRSVVADRMREECQVRVEARLERAARQEVSTTSGEAVARTSAAGPATKRQSLEDVRREARENWLRSRQGQSHGQAGSAPGAKMDRVHDDDFTR